MLKKILFYIVTLLVLIVWPVSLLVDKPAVSWETIFYANDAEQITLMEKLGLDSSRIKPVYYNKFSLVKDRYIRNVLVLLDTNNYFFQMHPREDVPNTDYRAKYFYLAIVLLIVAMVETARSGKYGNVWLFLLVEILVISIFRKLDGIDFGLYFPLSFLMISGLKTINKSKWAVGINLVLMIVGVTELLRIIL